MSANIYYWRDADKNKATYYPGPGMVEAPADEIEDFVECLYCNDRVPVELARDTNAGWLCDECKDHLS
jgi:hypothetical protein